jgi:hypothetical protein
MENYKRSQLKIMLDNIQEIKLENEGILGTKEIYFTNSKNILTSLFALSLIFPN